MRTVFVILMTTLLVCLSFSQLWAGAEEEKAAVSAAETWLSVVDGGNYSSSWNEASAYFQGAVTEQNWAASLQGVRNPLGKLVSRKIVKTQEANSLPGAPDGKYVVMSFKTVFAQKKAAVETVTFMLGTDGNWRAAGYFIK